MVMNKKAKLAHEKRKSGEGDNNYSRFAPSQIIGEVAWPKGDKNILVDLDGNGMMGIISAMYAMPSPDGEGLVASHIACPAVYDRIKMGRAHALYLEYQEANPA